MGLPSVLKGIDVIGRRGNTVCQKKKRKERERERDKESSGEQNFEQNILIIIPNTSYPEKAQILM